MCQGSHHAKRNLWAQLAPTAKRSYNAHSVMRESGRAQESRLHAKREISSLSETFISYQAQHMTGAKPKSTYSS